MKAKKLLSIAAMLGVTGIAFAQASTDYAEFNDFVSTKTRAQVRAELAKAYYAGEMQRRTEWVEHTNIASTRTRDEVRNEVLQAAKPRRPGSDS